jgi:hypothetical protein
MGFKQQKWWLYGGFIGSRPEFNGLVFTGTSSPETIDFPHFQIMGLSGSDFPLLQPIRWRKKSPGALRKSSVDMDVSHRPTHWGYHLSNKYLSDSDLRNSKNRTWRPTQPVENCSFTGKMTENDKKPWDSGSGPLRKSTYHSWRVFWKATMLLRLSALLVNAKPSNMI